LLYSQSKQLSLYTFRLEFKILWVQLV